MITLNSISLLRSGKLLLENASTTIHSGQHVGLVGANGCGKSSLLALLTGDLHPDKGEFTFDKGRGLAHMAQEIDALDRNAVDYVLDGDIEDVYKRQANECVEVSNNFKTAVMEGRRPGVELKQKGQPITLTSWGVQLLDEMAPIAELLDQANGSSMFVASLNAQKAKLDDVSLTPSAQLLKAIESEGVGYIELMMSLSRKHAKGFSDHDLSAERVSYFEQIAQRSIADQLAREGNDKKGFDEFLKDYMAAD